MKLNRYFTKTCARPVAVSLLATMACAVVIFSQPQPSHGQSLSAAVTGKEVYSWAKEAQQKLPSPETWDNARTETETDRRLVVLVKRGQAIVNRVIERGARMSAKEAAGYDMQMRNVVGQIDKLTAGPATAKGVSGCMTGCDGAYKGWGKGKGWNRFWCKVGCIKIKVGPAGVG
jgi:hypothetical protein